MQQQQQSNTERYSLGLGGASSYSSMSAQKGSIYQIAWLDSESLVCITTKGHVYIYTIFGNELNSFVLDRIMEENEELVQCKVWASGIVVLTKRFNALQGYLITNLSSEEPTCEKLADMSHLIIDASDFEPLDPHVAIDVVVRRDAYHDSEVDVIVACGKSLLIVNQEHVQDVSLSNGPHKKIAMSPSGEAIATFTESGSLWVSPSDFSSPSFEFSLLKGTERSIIPTQLVWCGEEALLLYWEPDILKTGSTSLVLMISPNREYQKFEYEGPVQLVGEVDGVRIISNEGCEFLQRVPDANVSIFRIGSLEPGAVLFDSYDSYLKKKPSSITNINNLDRKLLEAVHTCLEAAGHVFDEQLQERLLKAAAYGKLFPQCSNFHHETFVQMCKTLRVLNAVRDPKIGIPISYKQYEMLTPKVLIDRLVNRYHHQLAFKLCKYLDLKSENVLVHWACAKVCSNDTDEEILNSIKEKLAQRENISFATIAATAYRVGKTDLAMHLLNNEKLPGEQVPLLLNMGKQKLAISKAIESGETDLVYLVLLRLKKTLGTSLIGMLNDQNFRVARNLLRSFCQSEDHQFLDDYFQYLRLHGESGAHIIQQAFAVTDVAEQQRLLAKAKNELSQDKLFQEDARQTDNQIQLLEMQKELDAQLGQNRFQGLSITDSIYEAVVIGTPEMLTFADRIRKEYKISDSRYWWTMIRAMAAAKRWEDLFRFCKSKKSPIGYRPFAEVCIECGESVQAFKYVEMVSDHFEQVELYCRLDDFKRAIDIAADRKSVDMLEYVMRRTTNAETRNTCVYYIDKFS